MLIANKMASNNMTLSTLRNEENLSGWAAIGRRIGSSDRMRNHEKEMFTLERDYRTSSQRMVYDHEETMKRLDIGSRETLLRMELESNKEITRLALDFKVFQIQAKEMGKMQLALSSANSQKRKSKKRKIREKQRRCSLYDTESSSEDDDE